MPKWKTQTSTPDTCSDGQCVIFEKFDTLAEPRVIEVVGYFSRCGGHTNPIGTFPMGRILAWDGSWREQDVHLNWERAFYRFATNQGPDPVTPPAGPAASRSAVDGLTEAYAWHRRDNALKGRILHSAETEGAERDRIDWWFEGVGDVRQLHVDTGGQLNVPQRNSVESAAELSFGPGRIVWEG